jgi:hypothetical protein
MWDYLVTALGVGAGYLATLGVLTLFFWLVRSPSGRPPMYERTGRAK